MRNAAGPGLSTALRYLASLHLLCHTAARTEVCILHAHVWMSRSTCLVPSQLTAACDTGRHCSSSLGQRKTAASAATRMHRGADSRWVGSPNGRRQGGCLRAQHCPPPRRGHPSRHILKGPKCVPVDHGPCLSRFRTHIACSPMRHHQSAPIRCTGKAEPDQTRCPMVV